MNRTEVLAFTIAGLFLLLLGAALIATPSADTAPTHPSVTVYQDELGWQGR